MPMLEYDWDIHSRKHIESAEEIKKHFPYRSFKTYFSRENFLLTNHRETNFSNAMAVLESYDETVLFINSCNCGYRGHGPSNTVSLLNILNVPKDLAERYVFNHNAVELEFDEDGSLKDYKTNLWGLFDSRNHELLRGQIDVDEITFSDVENRTMYFLSPKGQALCNVVQLVNIMKPTNFSYFIGNDNKSYIDFTYVQDLLSRSGKYYKLETYSFFMIKGELFDVVCICEEKSIRTFINWFAHMLNITPPFKEVEFAKATFMVSADKDCSNKVKKIISVIQSAGEKRNFYRSFPLQRGQK